MAGFRLDCASQGIGVPALRVYDIVAEKRGVSLDTALRLSRYFGMSEGYNPDHTGEG